MVLASSHVDWGDIPTWVQAIVSFLALVAAIVAAVVAWRAFRLQRVQESRALEELTHRLDEERRAQASLVSAWLTQRAEGNIPDDVACVSVRNASLLPVYDVVAVIQTADTQIVSRAVAEWEVLPPMDLAAERFVRLTTNKSALSGEISVSIKFRDSFGRIWERNLIGRLLLLSRGD